VSNYNHALLRKSVEPVIYFYGHNYEFGYYLIKLNTQNVTRTLKLIESNWEEMYPDDPFDYFFLDDFIDAQYDADRRLNKAIMIFSSLAIIIAVLGLYGLSSLSAVQRTKEIGIRKVFGASQPNLFYKLSSNYILLIILANVISWPVAYLIMDSWLSSFITRIDIGIMLFLLPGLLVVFIAMITICYTTIIVAKTNPVDALRYE
jgi:putative ABC transport system permease protein